MERNWKQHFIGYYPTQEEAAKAAAAWRKENMPFSQEAASSVLC